MTRELHCLQYGEQEIRYEIVRRPRKTLEIAVEPDASVVIAAPEDATLEAIETKLRKRAAWVTRQQRYFSQFLPRTPERTFVAGETHLYLGRQYRLKVVPHVQESVKLIRGFIVVHTHRPTRPDVTRELVEEWYRVSGEDRTLPLPLSGS
jgi:predicted metal-dependent hydrolase